MIRRQSGFTLLEVLVALAVFAVAAVSLMSISESQLTLSRQIEDKTFAHWVALNQITEMQMRQAWPEAGEVRSRSPMAGRQWDVAVKTSPTTAAAMRRIEVTVSEASDDSTRPMPVLTSLTGFLERPKTGGGS
ncbi:general secretion pathway protein I [Fluviicoccus keumensis]|uniref:Type II secretion system protein I n=1 Tax=Fluviicoccus keumensis TaxID=1435465 RepID=A0A4Q7Z5P6_9GAMM|nr:type II secretion system minor pseudopilin GspI [Fluviicoccus keumensis]RZU45171.1 general secretion pathway protein I [Fluviicoccus keumensis]